MLLYRQLFFMVFFSSQTLPLLLVVTFIILHAPLLFIVVVLLANHQYGGPTLPSTLPYLEHQRVLPSRDIALLVLQENSMTLLELLTVSFVQQGSGLGQLEEHQH